MATHKDDGVPDGRDDEIAKRAVALDRSALRESVRASGDVGHVESFVAAAVAERARAKDLQLQEKRDRIAAELREADADIDRIEAELVTHDRQLADIDRLNVQRGAARFALLGLVALIAYRAFVTLADDGTNEDALQGVALTVAAFAAGFPVGHLARSRDSTQRWCAALLGLAICGLAASAWLWGDGEGAAVAAAATIVAGVLGAASALGDSGPVEALLIPRRRRALAAKIDAKKEQLAMLGSRRHSIEARLGEVDTGQKAMQAFFDAYSTELRAMLGATGAMSR